MVDGEATVKRLFREDDRIRLQPSHPEMSPIYIHAEDGRDTRVLGRVVGIYRDLP
jgi:repressor LexA